MKPGYVLPFARRRILRRQQLPFGHDEVVDLRVGLVAPGQDVERVAIDQGCRIGRVEAAVGEDRIALARHRLRCGLAPAAPGNAASSASKGSRFMSFLIG
jgi:hypothetical protein